MATVGQRLRGGARRVLPLRVRATLRQGYDTAEEMAERVLGRNLPLTPPARLMFVGSNRREYRRDGRTWVDTFIRVAGLQPGERVLDAGCGVGRMAVPLTGYLQGGSYEGFDIVGSGIEWCQREITSRFPNFRFQHADVHNPEYNPGGTQRATEYRFPYPSKSFDFVFLTSVFTHMLPAEAGNYLGEVHRVLRTGGRCLITFFLLDTEAEARIRAGNVPVHRRFAHEVDECQVADPAVPEAAVAYPEAVMRRLYEAAGLRIEEPVLSGGWSGRPSASGHNQDIVLAWKD
jgi:SAM-dependent methyltransferase